MLLLSVGVLLCIRDGYPTFSSCLMAAMKGFFDAFCVIFRAPPVVPELSASFRSPRAFTPVSARGLLHNIIQQQHNNNTTTTQQQHNNNTTNTQTTHNTAQTAQPAPQHNISTHTAPQHHHSTTAAPHTAPQQHHNSTTHSTQQHNTAQHSNSSSSYNIQHTTYSIQHNLGRLRVNRRGASTPLWGVESSSLPSRWPNPIPLVPPYVVRTPHLHGVRTTEETSTELCTDTSMNIQLVQGAGSFDSVAVTESALGVFHDKVDAKALLI